MDCDPICIYSTLVDAVTNGAAFIDYIGTSIVGERWQSLVPVIEDYSIRLGRLARLFLPRRADSCDFLDEIGALNA